LTMAEFASVQVVVRGFVQGVYFRAFTARWAAELKLTGYARNLPDGRAVEVVAEGQKPHLEELINHLKVGPPRARVTSVETNWSEYKGSYTRFSIKY